MTAQVKLRYFFVDISHEFILLVNCGLLGFRCFFVQNNLLIPLNGTQNNTEKQIITYF